MHIYIRMHADFFVLVELSQSCAKSERVTLVLCYFEDVLSYTLFSIIRNSIQVMNEWNLHCKL